MFLQAIVKFIKQFFFLINILFALYSLLVYQLVLSANIQHWIGGFLTLSFPLVLVGNMFFILAWVLVKSPRAILSLGMLLLTFSIRDRTFKLNFGNEIQVYPDISVLSYNLMYGDYFNYKNGVVTKNIKGISETAESLNSDIKCFQELYNNDKVYEFNLINRLSKENPFYVYVHSEKGNDKANGAIGLATFSKYPILKKQELYWGTNNNGLLASDIAIQGDTIRVINFQLKSMGIRVNKILDKNRVINKKETRNVLSQLKGGFIVRGQQVAILESWISESPYPVILAGDLNEVPYGYSYGKLRKILRNSFEDAGSGFGFTYRKILSFLRIDNQFYDSEKLKVVKFETVSTFKFSDHYPLYAEYQIIKERE